MWMQTKTQKVVINVTEYFSYWRVYVILTHLYTYYQVLFIKEIQYFNKFSQK